MRKNWYLLLVMLACLFVSCSDDDKFTSSPNDLLSMECDTLSFDTVFTRIPTAARYFWVYNNSGGSIRCNNVRLERGNQSGYRVNVDGVYLGEEQGYRTSDVEIRKGDSIRIFVELTAPMNYADGMVRRSDNIVFDLESGVRQAVNLSAWTWDADTVHTLDIQHDTVIGTAQRPLIIYERVAVAKDATLTIAPGSTLYFRDEAYIDVEGTLQCLGDSGANVTLRGYRIDNMFDYLPYDRLPGQWQGVRFRTSSHDNILQYTDIHSAYDGVVCDSTDTSFTKLTIANSTIHNCQGYGLCSYGARIIATDSQFTNVLRDCVAIHGGNAQFVHCTVGQFYPFDSARGNALYFSNHYNGHDAPLDTLAFINSIVTGYGDDVIMGESLEGSEAAYDYIFLSTILRTPFVDDQSRFINVQWERPDTEIGAEKHFIVIDTEAMRYDFHLEENSPAVGVADTLYIMPRNRDGVPRDKTKANLGCF